MLVLDGAGHELECEVQAVGRDTVHLNAVEKKSAPRLPCEITLLQSLPKGKIIESIIQKATELGVSRIVPLLSERVATRVDGGNAVQKQEKWQFVAVEAIKQCGAAWLPRVEAPVTPAEFRACHETFELPLVASLQPGSQHAGAVFRAFQNEHGRKPRSVCVWIGPEGDFTPLEISEIESTGARPISLGPLVLRVETAAIYCLSIVNHEISR